MNQNSFTSTLNSRAIKGQVQIQVHWIYPSSQEPNEVHWVYPEGTSAIIQAVPHYVCITRSGTESGLAFKTVKYEQQTDSKCLK